MAQGHTLDPVAIADVGRPHGLKGQSHVTPIGEVFTQLQPPCEVLVGKGADTVRPVVLEEVTELNKGYLCRFAGVTDRDGAEGLRGNSIFVDARELPSLGEREFYHFELEGMAVVATDGSAVGRVRKVHNYPTVGALEVERKDGAAVLIPLTGDVVGTVDRDAGRIVVDMSKLDELA